jgi:uncharacterized protein YihD (DUF1040 family)
MDKTKHKLLELTDLTLILKEQMMDKALKSDISSIKKEFPRFALYEDYKSLVARVEP